MTANLVVFQIKLKLDTIAEGCRRHLVSLGVELDPASYEYDLPNLCVRICSYMRDKGWGPLEGAHKFTSVL
jgi:hypothetical protein